MNPPDMYILVSLIGDHDGDLAAINQQAEKGYRVAGIYTAENPTTGNLNTFAVMGNYQGK